MPYSRDKTGLQHLAFMVRSRGDADRVMDLLVRGRVSVPGGSTISTFAAPLREVGSGDHRLKSDRDPAPAAGRRAVPDSRDYLMRSPVSPPPPGELGAIGPAANRRSRLSLVGDFGGGMSRASS